MLWNCSENALETLCTPGVGIRSRSYEKDGGAFGNNTLQEFTWARGQGLRRLGHSTGLLSVHYDAKNDKYKSGNMRLFVDYQ